MNYDYWVRFIGVGWYVWWRIEAEEAHIELNLPHEVVKTNHYPNLTRLQYYIPNPDLNQDLRVNFFIHAKGEITTQPLELRAENKNEWSQLSRQLGLTGLVHPGEVTSSEHNYWLRADTTNPLNLLQHYEIGNQVWASQGEVELDYWLANISSNNVYWRMLVCQWQWWNQRNNQNGPEKCATSDYEVFLLAHNEVDIEETRVSGFDVYIGTQASDYEIISE